MRFPAVSSTLPRHVDGDGTYFPEGTTCFRCFSHPHAGEGAGLAIVSAMLAIVIAFASVLIYLITRDLQKGPESAASADAPQ